ncbi:MAG: hypothetical protein GX972_04675 [Amphibacillus sp.]|uniref:Uncharacterized protein n=1 Tax=Amphibacillus xylanus (strain ATCC 51415 / DSM 6626 / JCM 7361 / LMG 17667 / NBRC 15112 / Ep01) TaxID=698758 RepID=K0J772_AMPXN|nr:hypothetical protein [Amphibacillus xylanus]NMA90605.1 hypothetical protein [Amphibacillus sp.]BAM47128.1 hypothetical protein AXY_09960 [Amphibacillus xylanus NBRC 15112]
MFRNRRFRIPPEYREYLIIIEKSLVPITIVQIVRAILFPSLLDIVLLGIFIGVYMLIYLDLI